MSTTLENLKRDIDTLKESVRLIWVEIDREKIPEKRNEMKKAIFESYVPEIKELLRRLENEQMSKGDGA